ncbi:hypothetical protein YC2023_102827 [Brassica napus]
MIYGRAGPVFKTLGDRVVHVMDNKGMEMVSRSRVVDDARSLLLLPQTSTYGHVIIPRKIDGACLNLGREGTVPSSQVSRCYWAEEKDNPELYWCSSATKENHDLSIGGSSRPWKTAKNGEKRRETVIYLSIGGSLTRSIPDTVAVEPNRKVFCSRRITHVLHTKGQRFIIELLREVTRCRASWWVVFYLSRDVEIAEISLHRLQARRKSEMGEAFFTERMRRMMD